MLLASLPKKYNTVITSLLVEKTTLALDEIVVVLLESEKLMKQGSGSSSNNGGALVVDYRGKKKGSWKKYNPNIKCFYYGELGHIQTMCPKAKKDLKELKKTRGIGVLAMAEVDDGELLMVHGEKEPEKSWVLDSGTSYHICRRRDWFSSYEECEGKMVTLSNGDKANIEGMGEVKIRLHDDQVIRFGDVRYIPNINRNLISLGRLDFKGCTIHVKNGVLEVIKIGKMILNGRRGKTNLFTFDEDELVQGEVLISENEVRPSKG
ncbi:hypothetical protein RND81_12G210800 [Saponaria officinalis]|uniref:Retrovirus-related Pol polyprotein from transposon TNT 1-94-like beta-barrel domain-containing protein n=1 Tax=Saponaria officinalis TaxID=3572 RepID=A0AAW1HDE4_SAPOF